MEFKKGFYDFSRDAGMNFQLNRFYSLGGFEKEELMEIGRQATDFEKWISLFTAAGDKTAEEGNHLKAAQAYRAAHFYTLNDAKDKDGASLKERLYETCMEHYDACYSKTDKPKGISVFHGGYDILIQEFLCLLP